MKIYGFEITAVIEGSVATEVLTKKTFVFSDVESAVRSSAGKLIDAHIARVNTGRTTSLTSRDVVMRTADALLRQWKKHGVVKKGAKHTEWVPAP